MPPDPIAATPFNGSSTSPLPPVLRQFDSGPHQLPIVPLQLGFQPFEQGEGIGRGAGETADHAAVMQAADLPGVGLHHRLPHGDLSVPSDDDFAILADGHDGGAMPDGHG